MLGVEVRGPMFVLRAGRVGLVGLRAGTFVGELVDALAIAIVEVEEEAAIKLTAQPSIQRIVIRIDVAGGNVNFKERRIGSLQEILVHQPGQFVAGASLVAYSGNQSPRQSMLDVE